MSIKLMWNLDVQITGGPKINESQTLEIDAYDLVDISAGTDNPTEINVQPNDAGQVQFLLIKIKDNTYSADLTYHLNTEENDPDNRIKLDSIHVLFGEGAIGLYAEAPQKIFLYNDTGDAVPVQILIGRKAVI